MLNFAPKQSSVKIAEFRLQAETIEFVGSASKSGGESSRVSWSSSKNQTTDLSDVDSPK